MTFIFDQNEIKYEYHHMGIPTTESHPDERYVKDWDMHTWGFETSDFHIQWHRYGPNCSLPEVVKTLPHPAFKVDNIEKALKGRNVLVEPFSPLEGWLVAFIEEGGAPIEIIRSDLTDEEVKLKAEAYSTRKIKPRV